MSHEPLLQIVLHQPEIPQNTGNIGRTCVAVGAKLWLVRPLGFRMDARHLRRAGMDYWEHLEWEAVDGWRDLVERLGRSHVGWDSVPTGSGQSPNLREYAQNCSKLRDNNAEHLAPRPLWFFSKTANRLYTDAGYRSGDVLVFGSETQGLPPSLLQADPERVLRIPMRPEARSLNLASAVAIAAYEAVRQVESVHGAIRKLLPAASGS